jgi:hypothetical protein
MNLEGICIVGQLRFRNATITRVAAARGSVYLLSTLPASVVSCAENCFRFIEDNDFSIVFSDRFSITVASQCQLFVCNVHRVCRSLWATPAAI